MQLDFMNMKPENKETSNAILQLLKLTGRDAARDSHQVRQESLKIFQPSYASSNAKYWETLIFERFLFVKRRISQPKTQ